MAQTTVNLQCLGDTYVESSNPNTNYSAQTLLKIKPDPDIKISYFKFDISSLPARKRIISAYLKVYFQGLSSPGNFANNEVLIRSYDVDINENQITFNARPELVYDSVYHGKALTAVQQSSANSYVNLLVTSQIASAYSQNRQNLWIECRYEYGDEYEQTYTSKESATNKPYLEIVYEDVLPNAPTPTDPIGDYKDNKAVVRFAWQYNSDVGGVQKAFDLQWSTDQINWTTVSQTISNMYYDMPADTLPAGNIYWRVRCYNEYDEVGPYCDIQSFYAIGAPAAPVLNAIPSNTARPVVTWSAFNQQVYQLQVLSGDTIVYDSGVVPGISIRQHKIKAWLADGEYTVKLRIKNEYDLWSEWGSATFEIATAKPTKPSVNLQRAAYGIELHIEDIADYALIFRADYDTDDYICISKTTSATYVDNSVRNKGEYKYFIRSVSADETFEDSDIKFAQAEFQYSLLAPVSDLSKVFVFARSLNAPPKRTYSHQLGGAFVEYVGRKHPVWEPTEHIAAAWSMAFYLKNWTDVEDFVALVNRKETVLYRDAKGRKVYGVLGNLSVNDERGGYMVSFTLTEVDYNEELEV
jgi:hypothetical protein